MQSSNLLGGREFHNPTAVGCMATWHLQCLKHHSLLPRFSLIVQQSARAHGRAGAHCMANLQSDVRGLGLPCTPPTPAPSTRRSLPTSCLKERGRQAAGVLQVPGVFRENKHHLARLRGTKDGGGNDGRWGHPGLAVSCSSVPQQQCLTGG